MDTSTGRLGGIGMRQQSFSLNDILEWPQQLLQLASGAAPDRSARPSLVGGQDGSRQTTGSVTSEPGSQFALRFEPRSAGGGLCHTGVLVATCHSVAGGAALPIQCRWKRRIGMHEVDIDGIDRDQYHLSADDIGVEVVCQASSTEGAPRGGGTGVIGPVKLDPNTRMSLEQLVASGMGPFPVRHYRNVDDHHPREVMIRVTPEGVKVIHPGAARGNDGVSVCYCADFPRIVLHPTNQQMFTLELSDDPEHCFCFVALSRCSRDLIALLIRSFHSRQYVARTFLLSRMTQNPATPGAPFHVPRDNIQYDLNALSGRIARELQRTVRELLLLSRYSCNQEKEKHALQEQLRETIQSYTEAIEQMHQQVASAGGGQAGYLHLQLHDARAVYSQLQLEMQELKPQLEEAQLLEAGASPLPPSGVHTAEVAAIRGDIANLRASIAALASTSRSAPSRSAEIGRLLQDVEVLRKEKDELQRCAKQAESDKKDLVENFLYIKGCFDKLQMASVQAPTSEPEAEREVAQLKAAYDQAVDERNRYAVRFEALERDREKQKGSRESAVERMMIVNSRLIEERDQLEREKARISELYARTVGVTGLPAKASADGAGDAGEAGPGTGGHPNALEALQAELAGRVAMLEAKQEETDSLRARLRKLATV